MLDIPIIRWGKPYESMEKADVVHFETGEVMAQMHQALHIKSSPMVLREKMIQ